MSDTGLDAVTIAEILAVNVLQLFLVLAAVRDVLEHPRMYLLILGLNYIILLVFWFTRKVDFRRKNRGLFWILLASNPLATFVIMAFSGFRVFWLT
jgi:hypothetical protein